MNVISKQGSQGTAEKVTTPMKQRLGHRHLESFLQEGMRYSSCVVSQWQSLKKIHYSDEFYILNLIIPYMSILALLKRNYFAIFDYHHISMISCNPTAFLNYSFKLRLHQIVFKKLQTIGSVSHKLSTQLYDYRLPTLSF